MGLYDTLKERLNYDALTGVFTWKDSGLRAGYSSGPGYRAIAISNSRCTEHRLAYYFVHGSLPRTVDHINGDKKDNRICNLRAAEVCQNIANGKHRKNNTSGKKGVSLHDGKWFAKITVNRKQIYLGRYQTVDEAHAVYMEAARKYFGEFARAG
jgi:hypothetical protein